MPWYGWLILAGIIMFPLTVLSSVAMATRTMRTITRDMDADQTRWRKRHKLGEQ